VSVWTGRDTKSAKEILKFSGIEEYITSCVGRCCVEKTKPYPDGLLKILTDSKNHGDEVFMIGDHVYDMQGATAAGVKGLSVNWNNRFNENIESLSFQHFTKVSELMDWAKKYYLLGANSLNL
jgi:phosphoglycolate phosphatase-like HAD superfamily hydrolase